MSDPKPYYVEEDGRRYTVAEYEESAREGEYGGIIYNLARFDPRPEYDRQDEGASVSMRVIAQYINEYEVHTGEPRYEYLSFTDDEPTQTGVAWTFDTGYDEEHEAVQRVAEIRREHQYVRIVRRETD